jgi:asparagine synthetase B (glutamine-hydrolysing)
VSGWLAVAGDPGADAWRGALAARPPGEACDEWRSTDGGLRLAAWRRPVAEFPGSGLLARAGPACRAWAGLVLGETPDPERAGSLNGAFAAAEAADGSLRVWTDRHRQIPVWVRRGPGHFAASTEWSCLAALAPRPRLDPGALDLFLRSGELIDGLTLMEGVECMAAGTCLEVSRDGRISERITGRFRHRGEAGLGAAESAAEAGRRLVEAVRRIERTGARLVVPLSGGLDSRLLLAACEDPRRVPSITWGTPGCRDLRYASRFADQVGSPHEEHPFDPAAYPPLWADAVAATAGCSVVRDLYVLPFVPRVARLGDVMLNGLAGDVFLGGNFIKPSWLREPDLGRLAGACWRWRVGAEEEAALEGLVPDAGPPARERWVRSILARAGGRPIEALVDWLLDNRIFRCTNGSTALFRRSMESYAPFFDRDFADFLARVPLELRLRHRLYLRMIREACPAAGRVPWQRTALPPSWGHGAALASLALHRALRTCGRWTGLDLLGAQGVASPADWLRGPWKEAAGALVLDGSLAARGAVRPEVARRVWDAHQAGADFSRTLGALAAAELFSRRFLDRLPVPKGAG